MGIKAIPHYKNGEVRYYIVSEETGEVLDDAQGYGYRTAQKAYAAHAYKTRDRSKDKERAAKRRHIEKWMDEHKTFVECMDAYAFDIAKGSMGPCEKLDARFVKRMFEDHDLQPDFTAAELLSVWRKK